MAHGPQQFSGIPFVAGSIRGERSWDFREGVLRSPSFHHIWTPDENVSICQRAEGQSAPEIEAALKKANLIPPTAHFRDARIQNPGPGAEKGLAEVTWTMEMEMVRYPSPHAGWANTSAEEQVRDATLRGEISGRVVLDLEFAMNVLRAIRDDFPHRYDTCTCGFYAYLNGFNEYNHAERVTGIIEGYGETVIGTRGFRAQRARLLALAPGTTENVSWDVAPASQINLAMQRATMAFRRFGESPENPHVKVKKLRKAYPGIPVFRDVAIMRAEFPATDVKEVMEG